MANKLIYYINKWTTVNNAEEKIILSTFEHISVKKKELLLEPEQVCSYIFFVIKGCMRSYYVDDKGSEHIYQIRLDNSWISDL